MSPVTQPITAAATRMRGPTVFLAGLLGAGLVAACLAAAAAQAAPGDKASAAMTDAEGNEGGSVELTEMQNGTLLVAKLTGLPEGAHGFHVHTAALSAPPPSPAGGPTQPTHP